MLGENASAHFYGIAKSTDVPASSFPIQFVDASNVTSAPVKIGDSKSYLFPMDRVLRPPVGEMHKAAAVENYFAGTHHVYLLLCKRERQRQTASIVVVFAFFLCTKEPHA